MVNKTINLEIVDGKKVYSKLYTDTVKPGFGREKRNISSDEIIDLLITKGVITLKDLDAVLE